MNVPQDPTPIADHVLEQASEWFATLQDQNVSEKEKSEWKLWLNSSLEHQKAWTSIEEISKTFHKTSQSTEAVPVREILSSSKQAKRGSKINYLTVILLIGFLPLFTWHSYSPFELDGNTLNLTTLIGETRSLQLADGTHIWLNTNTKLRVRYDQNLRIIKLLYGEVLIETRKEDNQDGVLVVETVDGRMTALGTRFNVRYHKSAYTELSVFEGAVKIEPAMTTAHRVVNAGHSNVFNQQTIAESQKVDLARQAWTKGILLADNIPLCDFLDELSRYSDDEIICSKEVASINLIGSYSTDDIHTVFTALQSSIPVYIWQVNPGIWRVEKRK